MSCSLSDALRPLVNKTPCAPLSGQRVPRFLRVRGLNVFLRFGFLKLPAHPCCASVGPKTKQNKRLWEHMLFFSRCFCGICVNYKKNSHAPTGLLRVLLSAKKIHQNGHLAGCVLMKMGECREHSEELRLDPIFSSPVLPARRLAPRKIIRQQLGTVFNLRVLGRVLLPPGLQVLPWMFSPYMQDCDAFGTCLPPGFRKGTFTSRSCHGWFLLVRGILWWQRLEPGIGSLVVLRLGMLPLQ